MPIFNPLVVSYFIYEPLEPMLKELAVIAPVTLSTPFLYSSAGAAVVPNLSIGSLELAVIAASESSKKLVVLISNDPSEPITIPEPAIDT